MRYCIFFLLNKYGISFNTANEILKRFGKDLELLPESQEKRFLTDISNIMSNKGTEKPVCDDIVRKTTILLQQPRALLGEDFVLARVCWG